MAVIDSSNWELVTQETNLKKGPLVKVKLSPGRYVKMYEADAIAQGLIDAPVRQAQDRPVKSRPAAKDKMRRPEQDKAAKNRAAKAEEGPEVNHRAEITKPEAEADDFKAIDGVGPATARALAAHGIETFEELHDAGELDFLNAPLNAVIERWRLTASRGGPQGESYESGDV